MIVGTLTRFHSLVRKSSYWFSSHIVLPLVSSVFPFHLLCYLYNFSLLIFLSVFVKALLRPKVRSSNFCDEWHFFPIVGFQCPDKRWKGRLTVFPKYTRNAHEDEFRSSDPDSWKWRRSTREEALQRRKTSYWVFSQYVQLLMQYNGSWNNVSLVITATRHK